jgi:UDP-glucose 4-epimerase
LIFPSSAAVYGVTPDAPIDTDQPLNPVSNYGISKRSAENLIQAEARERGLSAAIVRFFSIYGPGLRKQLLWDTCVKATRGELDFFGTGDETRDWIHVQDASRLVLTLSAANHAGITPLVLNGGAGVRATVRQSVEKIFAELGIVHPPRFSGKIREGDPRYFHANVGPALRLGWEPRHTWQRGFEEYVAWYKTGQ